MLYFTVYPNSSHNTDILDYNSSIVLPGRAILEKLFLCIALAVGAIFCIIFQILCCFSCILAMVNQNSMSVELLWEKIEGNLRRADTELSMDLRRANTEPYSDFRKANTE